MQLARLSIFLEGHRYIGQFVKSIVVIPASNVSSNLLGIVGLHLPALERLEWVSWSGRDLIAAPEAADRPALRSLKLSIHDRGVPCETPSAYFDLSTLTTLEINIPDTLLQFERLLRDVSDLLTTLSILNIECEDLPRVLSAIRRFDRLFSLSLIIWRSTSPLPAGFLAAFRSLRHLRLAHDDIGPALSEPFPSLETLVITYPADDYQGHQEDGFTATHSLRRNVASVCRIAKEFPKRFPALRTIGLDPPYEAMSFAAEAAPQVVGLVEIAQQLRAAGFCFVDGVGTPWRPEWEQTV